MERTATPARIVQQLRKERVAQWHVLAQQLDCSTKTVQRALAQVGYYNSLNYNATFVTLQDAPRFDPHGLWPARSRPAGAPSGPNRSARSSRFTG